MFFTRHRRYVYITGRWKSQVWINTLAILSITMTFNDLNSYEKTWLQVAQERVDLYVVSTGNLLVVI